MVERPGRTSDDEIKALHSVKAFPYNMHMAGNAGIREAEHRRQTLGEPAIYVGIEFALTKTMPTIFIDSCTVFMGS
jgi:hypothetical protein